MYPIKNNKMSLEAFFFQVFSTNGQPLGWIIRLEAESYRKNNNGTNRWDVFFPSTGEHQLVLENTKKNKLSGTVGDWGGEYSTLRLRKPVETPFGTEYHREEVELVPHWWHELDNDDGDPCALWGLVEAIDYALRTAENEGFGPHGKFLELEKKRAAFETVR